MATPASTSSSAADAAKSGAADTTHAAGGQAKAFA